MIIYYCMGGLPSKFAPKCAQIRSALTPVLEAASTGFFAQLACELCRQCEERSPSYIASIICSIYLCTYVYSCISTFYLPLKVHFTVPLLLLLPACLTLPTQQSGEHFSAHNSCAFANELTLDM